MQYAFLILTLIGFSTITRGMWDFQLPIVAFLRTKRAVAIGFFWARFPSALQVATEVYAAIAEGFVRSWTKLIFLSGLHYKLQQNLGNSSEKTRTSCRVAEEDRPMIKVMCQGMHATGAQDSVISLHPTRFLPFDGLEGRYNGV